MPQAESGSSSSSDRLPAMLTAIAALITAVGGIVFGVAKSSEGSAERTAGYAVLSSHVDELITQAKADHDEIISLQSALAVVASRAAVTEVAASTPAPPSAGAADVAHLADKLKAQVAKPVKFQVGSVPRTLPEAVQVYRAK